MSTTSTGGFVFPNPDAEHPNNHGITMRDYFAIRALQGVLANHDASVNIIQAGREKGMDSSSSLAKSAYEFADAMIAQRSK